MKRIIDYAHLFLTPYLNKETVFVDFTLGNGHDSHFVFQKVKQLYAFDIQKTAIENTIQNYPELAHANLILDSHVNIQKHVSYFNAGIFNLGYLPTGDKNITTLAESTLNAIQNALSIMDKKGILIVVVYIGHENGKKEAIALEKLYTQEDIHISKFEQLNRNNSPYILLIHKK